jgi:hypothetical protein
VSHAPQLLWQAEIARRLRDEHGFRTFLWVVGQANHAVGLETAAFERVVNVIDGFSPRSVPERETAENLEYIADLERRCGSVFFRHYAAADRQLMRRRWPADVVARYGAMAARTMEREVALEGPFFAATIGENNFLPYRIAHQILGTDRPYWCLVGARHWDDRFFLDQAQSGLWPRCVDLYRRYLGGEIPADSRDRAEVKLHQVCDRSEQPGYVRMQPQAPFGVRVLLSRALSRRFFGQIWKVLVSRAGDDNLALPSVRELAHWIPLNVSATVRRRVFGWIAVDRIPEGRIATFFLHVEPEHAVYVQSFAHRDQCAVIENIAASLPANWRLVVKEHRPMLGRRPLSRYARLRRIPNVTLASDRLDSYELIRRSQVIFTLNGTAALEAVYQGIPAIIFGDAFFETFEGVRRVHSLPQLRAALADFCDGRFKGASRAAAVACLAAMHDTSYPGTMGMYHPLEDMRRADNVDLLTRAILAELQIVQVGSTSNIDASSGSPR